MNVFPITVLAADGQTVRHQDCRMVWDGTTTTVWAWPSGSPKAQPIIRVEGAPQQDGPKGPFALQTGDGPPITLRLEDSCGCGSKLKNYTPTAAKPVRAFTESP